MEYVSFAGQIFGVEVPPGAAIVGRDAFRTSTGVHAAAVVKAHARGGAALADLVYSAVPASWLGRVQGIDVGPMSGSSNVRNWLLTHGYAAGPRRRRASLRRREERRPPADGRRAARPGRRGQPNLTNADRATLTKLRRKIGVFCRHGTGRCS